MRGSKLSAWHLRRKRKCQTLEKYSIWQPKRLAVSQIELSHFDNLSRLDATGANLQASIAATGELDADRLKIGVETPPRFVISVRHIISELRAFPAYFTAFCHIIASEYTRGKKEFNEKLETRFITNSLPFSQASDSDSLVEKE